MSEPEKKKPDKEIHITVDNEQTKLLAEELARERLKNEKLASIVEKSTSDEDGLAEKKLQAIQKFGRPDLWTQATSKEMLANMLTNYINELAEKNKPTREPSGTAPLNAEQYGQKKEDLYSQKFGSYHEMIDTILDRMHNGTAPEQEEAKSYYEAILRKWVLEKKRNANIPEGFYDPNLPENLPALKELAGFKVPVRKEEGDIGKILLVWRKQRERLSKGEQQ